jgi:hypothetical protein
VAGRLDPRLFDVTGLLADGYDGRRADLPIIVSADSGVTGTVVHWMTSVKAPRFTPASVTWATCGPG